MPTLRRTGKPNSGKAREHKLELRQEAMMRQLEYDRLTTEEKIAKLDAGKFRAVKRRARLNGQ
jgi:hypothetical protein